MMNFSLFGSPTQLSNERVLLVPFEHERNMELRQIIFSDQIWKYMGVHIRTENDFQQYINQTLRDKELGNCYPFLVIDRHTNKVAGSTRYGYLNSTSEKCEIGWTWYGTDFQGTGLNKACKYELLKFGFETIGFRRIQFSADQENLRSQKAIEKLGATREGIFRNNYIDSFGNSRHDVYYSIIREEWDTIKTSYFNEFS